MARSPLLGSAPGIPNASALSDARFCEAVELGKVFLRAFDNGRQLGSNATVADGNSQGYAYSASLQLQCQGLPAGTTCQFFPSPAVLLPGTSGYGSLIITVAQGTALGTYPFTVVASDGNLTSQVS